jgi:hypothetical protein
LGRPSRNAALLEPTPVPPLVRAFWRVQLLLSKVKMPWLPIPLLAC